MQARQWMTMGALQVLVVGLATSTALQRWSELLPSGSPPAGRDDHAAVFDNTTGTMLVFGGSGSTGYLGDLHRYEVQTNAWSALSPSGSAPSARRGHTAVIDSVSRSVLVFGGYDGSRYFSDLHHFDAQDNAWSTLSPSGSVPASRRLHSAVFNATARAMLIFGGWGGGSSYNDVHSYGVQENTWNARSPSGSAPAPRHAHAAVLDTTSRTMLVFGGYGDGHSGLLNGLHGYNVQANAWSALSPSGSVPSARSDHTAVWDTVSRVLLVFGGYDSSGRLNDLHSYDVQANAWSALSPSGIVPSAREYHSAVLDSASRTMLLFGGGCCYLNDLHALELDATAHAATFTTTMTVKVCVPVSASRGEGHCEACAPGRFGAGGSQTCAACASGHDSKAGSSTCQPTLGHVVGSLAEPALTTSRISSAVVKLDVAMSALPQDIFNVQAFSYVVDIAPTAAALSAHSACAAKWGVSKDAATVHLNFAELSRPCSTNVSNTDSGVRRDGVVGVHLLADGGSGMEVAVVWVQDLTLTFDPHTDAPRSVTVVEEVVTLGAHTFHIGAFTSTLQLFASDDFTTVKRMPVFRPNDIAHVGHALDEDDDDLRMELVMAWLSRSSNVSDLDAVEHNLTSTLVQHDGGSASSLRYSFSAKPCRSCHLHSLARVFTAADGQRLESLASFTVQSLYLEVGADAVDILPKVILGPAAALSVSAAVAVTVGILAGLWGHQVHREAFGTRRIQGFLTLGFCDSLCGAIALVLVHAEGALRFSNDGGAVFIALATSVGLSAFLFFTEVGFWARWNTRFAEAQKKTIHILLSCAHLAMVDSFQTIQYAFVAASDTRTGSEQSASVLVAALQAVVFTMARIAEAAGMQLRCPSRREDALAGPGAEAPPAFDAPAPAVPPAGLDAEFTDSFKMSL